VSNDNGNTIVDLIQQVKSAIRHAEDRSPDKKLAVTQVDLEIKTTFKKEIEADGKVSWLPIPIELTAHHTQSEIQTLSLTLVPLKTAAVLMGTVADELADAIEAIRAGLEEAAESYPPFNLKDASISLNIGTTTDGKVMVIVGGEVDSENAHTVKLTLAPAIS
jgi:hypothetical protein